MQKINNLSVCIMTLNNESTIKKCLDSVSSLAAEVVVGIDDLSNDGTYAIAKKYTDKVFLIKHIDNFDLNKNKVIEKAKGKWILWLDGDEYLEDNLKKEIEEKIQNKDIDVYKIPRKNIVFRKVIENTGWYPDYQLRLFQKGKLKFDKKRLHQDPEIIGKVEKLENHIIHQNYQSVSQFLLRLDKYTQVEAENSDKQIKVSDFIKTPVNEFLKRFIVCKGYKDGLHGLVLSILQAFYEFIVLVKIWEKNGFAEEKADFSEIENELKKGISDFNWWKNENKIKEARNKIEEAFYKGKRKLGI